MKNIITIIRKFISKDIPNPVGRWRIDHSNTQINNKIDLSNEDHCGPCGQYALEKIKLSPRTLESGHVNSNNKIPRTDLTIENKCFKEI